VSAVNLRGVSVSILALLMLSGCASLGDLQAWNSAGKTGQQIGSVLRTVDSSCKVLTVRSCDQSMPTASQIANINRTQGQLKQLPYHYSVGNIPKIIAETNEVIR